MTLLYPYKNLYAIEVPFDAYDYEFINTRTKYLTFKSNSSQYNIAMDVPTLDRYVVLGEITNKSVSFKTNIYLMNHINDLNVEDIQISDLIINSLNPFRFLLEMNGLFFNKDVIKLLIIEKK